jgi:hypothetical protein
MKHVIYCFDTIFTNHPFALKRKQLNCLQYPVKKWIIKVTYICIEQSVNCQTDYHAIWYWEVLLKFIKIIQLKLENNNGYFTKKSYKHLCVLTSV